MGHFSLYLPFADSPNCVFLSLQCLRLREGFQQLLAENGSGEFPVKTMVEEVMTNTVKDEETELPHVFTPETEYHLSSIFVDMQRPTVTFLF